MCGKERADPAPAGLCENRACSRVRATRARCSCCRRSWPENAEPPPFLVPKCCWEARKAELDPVRFVSKGSSGMERFWLALGAIQSVTLQAFAVWEGDLVLRKPLNSGWKILMQAVPQKRMGLQTSGQPPARGWNGPELSNQNSKSHEH